MTDVLNPPVAPAPVQPSLLPTVGPGAVFPQASLMPPVVLEEARVKTAKTVSVAVVGASLVAVAGLFLLASTQVSGAEDELALAQATNVRLNAQAAEYAEVPLVLGQVTAAGAELTTVMAPEIRFSRVLNDLGLITPSGVAYTKVTMALSAASESKNTAANGTPGQLTFDGEATSFPRIAALLDQFGRQPTYSDPSISSATKEGTTSKAAPLTDFSGTVLLTDAALSGRWTRSGS